MSAATESPTVASLRTVAVIAHTGKVLGGGFDELRAVLRRYDTDEVLWYEVPKSRKAPKKVRKAVAAGAELIFVWGGDGMVQRCVDVLADSQVAVAIIPAGTANLLATSLGIPRSVPEAVHVGFHGRRRTLDLGRINGEHFAVMAGAGLDAAMIDAADGSLKGRLGRASYLWAGARHLRDGTVPMTVKVDGERWFRGEAGCLLVGNIGTLTGGVNVFHEARPDDGCLDIGVATADGALQWARTLSRVAAGRAEQSPFVQITRGRRVTVKLARPVLYELDGGARTRTSKIKVRVVPAALTVCVPDGC